MEMRVQQALGEQTISDVAESLAEEIATKMYHKLTLLKFLPEIKAIESGKLKALRGKEAHEFLEKLSK